MRLIVALLVLASTAAGTLQLEYQCDWEPYSVHRSTMDPRATATETRAILN